MRDPGLARAARRLTRAGSMIAAREPEQTRASESAQQALYSLHTFDAKRSRPRRGG